MTEALLFENSDRLCEWVAERSPTIALSFSGGKDSVACWIQCRRYFERIIPIYMYNVPGIRFIEQGLDHYEQHFGCHIYRMPHPVLYRLLANYVFQPPDRITAIQNASLPQYEPDDVINVVLESLGLDAASIFRAVGIRAYDSQNRWSLIKRYGAVNQKRLTFYPCYDWNKERLLTEIKREGVQLGPEYRVMPRSFDGFGSQYLIPIRDNFPADYKRILEWLPLAELEALRIEERMVLND